MDDLPPLKPKPVPIQDIYSTLLLAAQRLGNAAQGRLSQKTANIVMRRINRLTERMEEGGVDISGGFEFKPEFGDEGDDGP